MDLHSIKGTENIAKKEGTVNNSRIPSWLLLDVLIVGNDLDTDTLL